MLQLTKRRYLRQQSEKKPAEYQDAGLQSIPSEAQVQSHRESVALYYEK